MSVFTSPKKQHFARTDYIRRGLTIDYFRVDSFALSIAFLYANIAIIAFFY